MKRMRRPTEKNNAVEEEEQMHQPPTDLPWSHWLARQFSTSSSGLCKAAVFEHFVELLVAAAAAVASKQEVTDEHRTIKSPLFLWSDRTRRTPVLSPRKNLFRLSEKARGNERERERLLDGGVWHHPDDSPRYTMGLYGLMSR